ncbi:MAG: ribosomal RNA small subunit methyltransferase A [Planctomycetes bacterium]|nr:ribosomal RNA small subunit methyltransferase A [Planctomycetota bacterium]
MEVPEIMLKLAELKSLLARHGIRPHKRMGQNFLADGNMLRAIVRDAEVDKRSCVLEIGTGAGSLASALCEEAGLVITVEADRGMYNVASDALSDAKNVVMLQANALDADETSLNPELAGLIHAYIAHGMLDVESCTFDAANVQIAGNTPKLSTLRCVSNLPYSAAGPIITALLESSLTFERIVVMVQYEVGEKLCARVGGSAYGILSLIRAQFADARILRRVPSRVFWPRPKVDSAVVELRPFKKPDKAAYLRLKNLAHVLFQHRRKQGANALAYALDVPAPTADAWLVAAGADPNARPEDIPHGALQRLADLPDLANLVRDRARRQSDRALEKSARAAARARWRKPKDEEE